VSHLQVCLVLFAAKSLSFLLLYFIYVFLHFPSTPIYTDIWGIGHEIASVISKFISYLFCHWLESAEQRSAGNVLVVLETTRQYKVMARPTGIPEHIPNGQDDGASSEFGGGDQPCESPGMCRLQELATIEPRVDGCEVSARFMQRPISSGSTGLGLYAYGAPPKRDIHIPRKRPTALYGAPDAEGPIEPNSVQCKVTGTVESKASNQRRSGVP
jgi:hypothetical protein